jgi:beta-glucanase (GH16 family)
MVVTHPDTHASTTGHTNRRRSHRAAWTGGAAAVIALVAAVVVITGQHNSVVRGTPATAPAAQGGLSCGHEDPVKATGQAWSCTFDDEFSGTALAQDLWTPTTTAQTGFRGGQECIVAGADRVGGGVLTITASRTAARPCGSYTTSFTSGMVSTKNKFAQTYGRFEMRAKFPPGVGFQPAFWLVPQNPRASGQYEYGEIDIAEEWGNYPQYVDPHLHYVSTPDSRTGGAACKISTSTSAFHSYALTWTPTLMRFDYDGTMCWSTRWLPQPPRTAPVGAQAPVPFDQPFYIIVQLAVGGAKTPTNEPSATTKFPAHMEVDYVRAWS